MIDRRQPAGARPDLQYLLRPCDVVLPRPCATSVPSARSSATRPRVLDVAMDDDGLIPAALEEAIQRTPGAGKWVKSLRPCRIPPPAAPACRRARGGTCRSRACRRPVVEDNPTACRPPRRTFPGDLGRRRREDRRPGHAPQNLRPGIPRRVGGRLVANREKLILASEAQILCPPTFNQLAVSRYLATQPWLEQVKTFRELYRDRRDATARRASPLPPPAGQLRPGPCLPAGSTCWLTLPEGLDAELMQARAVAARVAYVPGIAFYADGNGRRNTCGCPTRFPAAGAHPRGGAKKSAAVLAPRGELELLEDVLAVRPRGIAGPAMGPPRSWHDRARESLRARRRPVG